MKTMPVFFTKQMVARSDSYSPSAGKPALVVDSWKRLGLPLAFFEPAPATRDELARAHDRGYVRDVLELRRRNGFDNCSAEVAASLPYTTGSMLSAARHAVQHGGAAVAPCSGFHHAGWDRGGGFCTFNGLMVTAATLRAEGAERIGILDCDMHYGDGTDDILERLGAPAWVQHFTAGSRFVRPEQAGEFLDTVLPRELKKLKGCSVVLYQAGADPHVDDPLGGWLTTAQLYARDRLVFSTLRELGVPVAWNLAGGYQRDARGGIPKVLEIHDNTMRACAEVHLNESA